MALFSDNPFVGMLRSQKRREAEAAMARQQAMAEQEQQKQKFSGQRLEQLRSTPSDLRGLEAMRGSNEFYSYGLGGSTPWTTKTTVDPQGGGLTRTPTLRQGYTQIGQGATLDSRPTMGSGPTLEPAGKKVGVMGVGTANRQEYRGIRNGLERAGAIVVEAPELFRRGSGASQQDRTGQFYSTATGRPMGSLLGRGAYGGFGKDATDEYGNPLARYSPQIMRRRAERGLNPYAPESSGYSVRNEPSSFYPSSQSIFPSRAISTPIRQIPFTGMPFPIQRGFGTMFA